MNVLSKTMHSVQAAKFHRVENAIRNQAARSDMPMHGNPVHGYRPFKQMDLDKPIMDAANRGIALACRKSR